MSKMKYVPIVDLDQTVDPASRSALDRPIVNSILDGYALYGAALYPPFMHSFRETPTGRAIGFPRHRYGRMHGPGDAANEAGTNDNLRVLPPLISDRALPMSAFSSLSAASGGQSISAGWVKSVASCVQRLWSHLRRERDIARSISLLASLDDRTLHDIGFHRSQISHVVRYGLDEPGRVQSRPS